MSKRERHLATARAVLEQAKHPMVDPAELLADALVAEERDGNTAKRSAVLRLYQMMGLRSKACSTCGAQIWFLRARGRVIPVDAEGRNHLDVCRRSAKKDSGKPA